MDIDKTYCTLKKRQCVAINAIFVLPFGSSIPLCAITLAVFASANTTCRSYLRSSLIKLHSEGRLSMDTELMREFIFLAEKRNSLKTARHFHISTSTLSRHMAKIGSSVVSVGEIPA